MGVQHALSMTGSLNNLVFSEPMIPEEHSESLSRGTLLANQRHVARCWTILTNVTTQCGLTSTTVAASLQTDGVRRLLACTIEMDLLSSMTSRYAASLSLSKETRPIRGKGLDFSHIIIILTCHRLVLGLPWGCHV